MDPDIRTPDSAIVADDVQLKEVISTISRDCEYVFTNPKTGKPYDYRKKMMKGLCKRSDVKPFGFHAIRHYCSSFMVKQGIPVTDMQQILGHERLSTTDLYLRSLGDGVKKAMEELGEFE